MVVRESFEQVEKEFGSLIRRIAISHEADGRRARSGDSFCAMAGVAFLPGTVFVAFVARIATNRAVSHVRRSARAPVSVELSEDLPASGSTPEHQTMAEDQQWRLLAAVQALPLSLRQVALLTLEGLGCTEISDVLGISPNAVAIRLSRAKNLLRHNLGDEK
jgi:RNA polymerase sigma-70 factor (ECF subfamily)